MDKNKQYKVLLTIGDWSGDGHERCDEYRYFSNKPIEQVREAHFKIKDATGIDLDNVCNQYGNDTLDKETAGKLRELGYELDESMDGCISADDMADIWVFLLMTADPELRLEPAPDEFKPIHFYGFDEQGRHIESVGYGLYT